MPLVHHSVKAEFILLCGDRQKEMTFEARVGHLSRKRGGMDGTESA